MNSFSLRWFLLAVPVVLAASFRVCAKESELLEYNITWGGVSVGTMRVWSQTRDDASVLRSLRVWSRPWISRLYPVDNTVQCVLDWTDEGFRITVSKKIGEKDFAQDDTLVLWPCKGTAVWSDARSGTVHAFEVPVGSRDYVSFFFDLREVVATGDGQGIRDYHLVMDRELHALDVQTFPSEPVRTPQGLLSAVPVRAVSRSPTLFRRNTPRTVWVSPEHAIVLRADVTTRLGTVRCQLVRWEVNGRPRLW